jgi:hypothetical protein
VSGETWRVWRHKENPAIRYYVEMFCVVREHIDVAGVLRHSHVVGSEPKLYPGSADPNDPARYPYDLVRLRSTRNDRFDDSDYAPHMAPEAGRWPREAFEALYEMEEEEK